MAVLDAYEQGGERAARRQILRVTASAMEDATILWGLMRAVQISQPHSQSSPSVRINLANGLKPHQKGVLGHVWSRERALQQGATIIGEEVELVFQIRGKNFKVRADLLLFDELDEVYVYVEAKYSPVARFTTNQKVVVPELIMAGDEGLLAEIGARTGGGPLQEGLTVRVVFEGDVWDRGPALVGDIQ